MKNVDVITYYKQHKLDIKNAVSKGQFDDRDFIISNELTRQNTTLTLEEEKLMHCIFSQIDGYSKKDQKRVIKLYKKDLFELLEMNRSDRYSELKSRFKSLTQKSVVDVRMPNGNDVIAPVIVRAESNFKSDHFEIQLNEVFMPYLEKLATHYTTLNLNTIVRFDSKYSLMLYKYLSSWRTDHYERMMSMTTKELKELFGLSKKDYVSNGKFDRYNFEKYTINRAVNEIQSKVKHWRIGWEKVKKGSRVTGYIIHWADLSQMNTHDKSVSDEQLKADYEQYHREHVDENQMSIDDL